MCTSVNEVCCHGIPDARQLQKGDIINIDVTVYLNVSALQLAVGQSLCMSLASYPFPCIPLKDDMQTMRTGRGIFLAID